AVALSLAAAIAVQGFRIVTQSSRVLVDEALPDDELTPIRETGSEFGPRGGAGFHKLRPRPPGARRDAGLPAHVREGTTPQHARTTTHQLQDAIRERLGGADVLIHLEPADRVQPGTEVRA